MQRFADGVYIEQAEVRFYGVRLQTRMAVVLLPQGRLLLYSPTWLTPALRSELERLGQVAYILSPNKIHNQTLRGYSEAFPKAEIHAPPGLAERCPDLRVQRTLEDQAPPEWSDTLDQALTGGNVFFSEAVLLHPASRTLLVGDLVEYIDGSTLSGFGRAAARLFGVGSEPVGSPEFRLYTHDPDLAARSFARIVAWDFDKIFLCHGRLITEDAKQVLKRVTEGIQRAARQRTTASRWLLRRMASLQ
jgi:hypothetical protein